MTSSGIKHSAQDRKLSNHKREILPVEQALQLFIQSINMKSFLLVQNPLSAQYLQASSPTLFVHFFRLESVVVVVGLSKSSTTTALLFLRKAARDDV